MSKFVCPDAERHGSPFRYCPVKGCGWIEPTEPATPSDQEQAEAEWEAIRQTVSCPSCNGVQTTGDIRCRNCGASASLPLGMTCNDHRPTFLHCPDCTDGKIPMARLLAVGAAVFTTAMHEIDANDMDTGAWVHNNLLENLRAEPVNDVGRLP